jgi:pimeloyl-ACP methyl ester carboxylesterase
MVTMAAWIILFVILLLLPGFYLIKRTKASTQPILGAESIAQLERVRLGDEDQCVLIRGKRNDNPVLLFLHGGPGMPLMYLAHHFQRPLENDFTMVQWDRRGAGKSYDPNLPLESLSVSQLIADTHELTNLLRQRFGQDKIYLAGHSWGTYLGMWVIQRYPELFHAYIGIGQLTTRGHDSPEIAEIQDRFVRLQAEQRGDQKTLKELADGHGEALRETHLFRFGGEIRGATSMWPLLWIGLRAPEYTLAEAARLGQASSFVARNLRYDITDERLIDAVREVQIPIFFFTGRYDYTDPFELTEQYFKLIQAPHKELVWFENSAHFPFLEEPDRFAEEMRRIKGKLNR